jgi:hypothetical protein
MAGVLRLTVQVPFQPVHDLLSPPFIPPIRFHQQVFAALSGFVLPRAQGSVSLTMT